MPFEIDNFDALIEHLNQKSRKIITIDGRDGTGKTYLSKQLHKELGGTLLSEKKYRSATHDGLFEFDRVKLLKDISLGLSSKPVFFESCFMLWILKKIGLKPDVSIYIKTLSATTNMWTDEDELAEEPTKKLALEKEINFGKRINNPPSNFRLQMISYHYDFKPQDNSDIVYLRTENYNPPYSN